MSQEIFDYQPLPMKLQQLLQDAALPTPIEVFSMAFTKTLIWVSLWIVEACGLFIMALLLTVATWSCQPVSDGGFGCNVVTWSLHLWSTNALLDALQLCWCLIFLLVLAFLLHFLIYSYRHRYLCVYPWGLFSPTNLSFPWERIQKVWRGQQETQGEVVSIQMDSMRLLRDDGKRFSFTKDRWNRNNTQQRLALCNLVEREVVRLHLPVLLERFDRGEVLSFGPLSISRTCLGNKKRQLAWEQVERFEISETRVRIRISGQALDWYSASVPDLPNVCLLREIAYLRDLLRKE